MIDIEAFNSFANELSNYNYYKKEYIKQKDKIDNMWYLLSGVSGCDPSKEHAESFNQPFLDQLKLERLDELEIEQLKLQSIKLKILFIEYRLNKMPEMTKKAYINIYIKRKSYNSECLKMNLTLAKLKYLMQKEFEI